MFKESNIHASLHQIFTSSYQKKLLKEEAREALMYKFYSDIGEDVAEDLIQLAEWLKDHPKRRRIIAWLHEQLVLDEDDFDPEPDDLPLRETNGDDDVKTAEK